MLCAAPLAAVFLVSRPERPFLERESRVQRNSGPGLTEAPHRAAPITHMPAWHGDEAFQFARHAPRQSAALGLVSGLLPGGAPGRRRVYLDHSPVPRAFPLLLGGFPLNESVRGR
eukprot:6462641-Pyramimonas_sp.AAC.1